MNTLNKLYLPVLFLFLSQLIYSQGEKKISELKGYYYAAFYNPENHVVEFATVNFSDCKLGDLNKQVKIYKDKKDYSHGSLYGPFEKIKDAENDRAQLSNSFVLSGYKVVFKKVFVFMDCNK